MPGFVINGQGGDTSRDPAHTVETRRKHRWRFTTIENLDQQTLILLMSASRPKFILEEPVLHHNQEQAYFAGKQSWDPITIVWYDGEQDPDCSSNMFDWVNTVVEIPGISVFIPSDYKREATLDMLDGTGSATETWRLFGAWPKETNWGELDYTNTEIATIEVMLRYDRAVRE